MAIANEKSKLRAFRGALDVARPADEDARAIEFERLYRESYPTVYGRVLFRTRDEEAARDVTAEAFLRAARYFDRFDPSKAKFPTWVNAIARNCIAEYFRGQTSLVPLDNVPESAFASEADHAQNIADADLARRLLAVLDEEDRDIVFMKFCEDRANTDIAQELGMKPSTVATRAQRALEKMRVAARRETRA